MKIVIFTTVKNRCILHGRVFVMPIVVSCARISRVWVCERFQKRFSLKFAKFQTHIYVCGDIILQKNHSEYEEILSAKVISFPHSKSEVGII